MKYKNRYPDAQRQNAYMNACDCLRYGYGVPAWNKCGLNESTAKEVWKQAFFDMTQALF